ncbi:MAG: DUF1127 domain-containing protein [Kiloniellales bacterium]
MSVSYRCAPAPQRLRRARLYLLRLPRAVSAAFAQRLARRRARAQLMALSDHQLRDIGLSRDALARGRFDCRLPPPGLRP